MLESVRSQELIDAAYSTGVFTRLSVDEQCRLFRTGVCDFERELCDIVYRGWRTSSDPGVRFAIDGLAAAGGSESIEVLRSILPELAELVQTEEFGSATAPFSSELSVQNDVLSSFVQRVLRSRVEQVRDAIARIEARGA